MSQERQSRCSGPRAGPPIDGKLNSGPLFKERVLTSLERRVVRCGASFTASHVLCGVDINQQFSENFRITTSISTGECALHKRFRKCKATCRVADHPPRIRFLRTLQWQLGRNDCSFEYLTHYTALKLCVTREVNPKDDPVIHSAPGVIVSDNSPRSDLDLRIT